MGVLQQNSDSRTGFSLKDGVLLYKN
ncbi:hypothetical protein L195_g055894, partial [Trifolium pratense]